MSTETNESINTPNPPNGMAEQLGVIVEADPSADIYAASVCLITEHSQWNNSAKLPKALYQTPDIKQERTRANNDLVADFPEWKALRDLKSQFDVYIKSRAVPSILRGGCYMLPLTFVEEVEAKAQAYIVALAAAKVAFAAAWPAAVETAEVDLGPAFNASQYPEASDAAASFGFKRRYLQFKPDQRLKKISAALAVQQDKQFQQEKAELQQGLLLMFRQEFAKWVSAVSEKLTGTTDTGRRKGIHATFLPKLNDFLDTFAGRNIAGDTELPALIERAKAAIAGVDGDTLKKDAEVRAQLKATFEQLSEAVTPMIVGRVKRAFAFDEE